MELVAATPYDEAVAKLGAKSPVASVLNSAQWAGVPPALRDRAFFSSTVESVRFLQRGQDSIKDFLASARDPDTGALKTGSRAAFVQQMQRFAIAEGMGPLKPADKGTIKDITSQQRLGLIFDVQTKSARDFGNWKQGMDPAVLDEFPAQKFIRVRRVRKPRAYHQAALGKVALKTDLKFWIALNPDFGVPWGPWGYNSGCDVEDVDRAAAEKIGLLRPGQKVAPALRRLNDGLKASLKGLDDAMVGLLKSAFGDQVSFLHDTVYWTAQDAPRAPRQPRPQAPPPPPPQPVGPPEVPYKAEVAWTTGQPEPGQLGGIPFAPVAKDWWKNVKDVDVNEPKALKKINRAGIIVQEADGRIWIVEPTNHFGNREHTWPGGGVEPGLTVQQNAMKEVWEETGLQVKITGYIGDFRDSNNGNNGRLYIGQRVGGAPWDAKIESFIRDRTGKPAAESEKVKLVTLDQAAKLLHRTDDVAQLAAIRPIPIDTPTSGKGSEPLKKLLEGIQASMEQYKADTRKAGGYPGTVELHEIARLRGFNGLPTVVDKKEFDRMKAAGEISTETLRGVAPAGRFTAAQFADQYKTGDHFAGHGMFGSGTYTDSWSGGRRLGTDSSNRAASYASYSGTIMRLGLRAGAKVINIEDLEKAVSKSPALFTDYKRHPASSCWLGVQAALAGYDAIYITGKSKQGPYGKGFLVILNRSIVVAQDTPVSSGYKIP